MTAKNTVAKRAISNLQVEPCKFLPTTEFLNEFLPDETKKIKLTFDVPVYLFAEGRKLPVTVNLIKVKGETFDPNDFELALADAFSRILSRNSVFASVALPAAANEQSTFLNQVFVGLFRPDGSGDPRWFGNLKQYQLGIDESDQTLKALDADAIELIDSTSGFLQGCARSFWTDDSGGSPYWEYLNDKAVANCDEATRYYNNPDGPIVEKGGQAYVLRESTPSSRAVYTCDPTTATLTCSVLTSFYDGNNKITAELLDPGGSVSTAERTELIIIEASLRLCSLMWPPPDRLDEGSLEFRW